MAVGKYDVYKAIDLFGDSNHDSYAELKKWYDVYCQIGGYPAVVNQYLATRNIKACQMEVANIIRIFVRKSERYFDDILEMNLLEQMLQDGKIKYLYLLKGDSYGGIEEKKYTVPLYLAERIRFKVDCT